MEKIMLVYGTRPQLIKMGVLYENLVSLGLDVVLVHTGQHYDYSLSQIFMEQVGLPQAKYNLGMGSTVPMSKLSWAVTDLLEILNTEQPSQIVVIGDTDSTLVGCLGAFRQNVPLTHIEAGVRSHDRREPEENIRFLVDHLSSQLLYPTGECLANLSSEGIDRSARFTGDLRFDAWNKFQSLAVAVQKDGKRLGSDPYLLFTLHRRNTAYRRDVLTSIVDMLASPWPMDVVWPVHPGVLRMLHEYNLFDTLAAVDHLWLSPAVGFLEMIYLEKHAHAIITDSVGVQIESYFAQRPSVVLRDAVEFESLRATGWSINISPFDADLRLRCIDTIEGWYSRPLPTYDSSLFGDGHAAMRITECLLDIASTKRIPTQPSCYTMNHLVWQTDRR